MKFRVKRLIEWFGYLRQVRGFMTRLIVIMAVMLIVIILLSALLVLHLEKNVPPGTLLIRDYQDALWWAVVTVATVGYGDVVPRTSPGRAVGILLMVVGFIITPLLSGVIASKMIDDKLRGARGVKPLNCKGHILICGWYDIGHTILKALSERKFESPVALIAEITPEVFAELQALYPGLELLFIRGDASQRETMNRSNLKEAQQVLILPDQSLPKKAADDRSVVVASTIRFVSKTIPLTVQLLSEENRGHLEQIGVDNIVIFNEFGGYLLANNVVNRYYASFTDKILHDRAADIRPLKIPHTYIGRSWGDLRDYLIKEEDVLPIGMISEHRHLELADIFSDDNSSIDAFIRSALERARSRLPEQRFSITLKPDNDYIIRKEDQALILG